MIIDLLDIVSQDQFLVDASGQLCQLFRMTLHVLRPPKDRSVLSIDVRRIGQPAVQEKIAFYQLPTFGIWLPMGTEEAGTLCPCKVRVRHGEQSSIFKSTLAFGKPKEPLLHLDRLDEWFGRSVVGEKKEKTSSLFEHTSFHTDVTAYLQRHRVVYQQPVSDWMDGQVVGNGDLVAVIHNYGPIAFHLNKSDVWAMDETGRGLGTLTCAHLTLEADFMGVQSGEVMIEGTCSQAMDIAEGVVETGWNHGDHQLTTRSWIAKDKNLLVTEVEGSSPGPSLMRLRLERDSLPPKTMLKDEGRHGNEWYFLDYEMAPRLETSIHENSMALQHELPNMEYSVACRIEGTVATPKQRKKEEGVAVFAEMEVDGVFNFRIITSVTTSLETKSPLPTALKEVSQLKPRRLAIFRQRQREAWRAFWSKSFVHLEEDPFLENLWYVSLYHTACVSQGKIAPGFLGAWWCEDLVPWFNQYVSDSQCQLDHWLCFSSNHLELARPFHLTYGNLMKQFMAHGPEGGLAVPHMFFPEHGMIDLSNNYQAYVSSAPWLFQTFIWEYEYTGNERYLRDFLYPVLKATAATLKTTALRSDETGAIHVEGDLPEQQDTFTDNPMNLFVTRMVFGHLVKYSRLLKIDATECRKWQELLDHLTDYPQDEKCIRESEEQGHPFRKHPSVFFPVYPGMDIAPEDPLAEKYRNTFDRAMEFWGSRYDCLYADGRRLDTGGEEPNGHSLFWIAAIASRLFGGKRAIDLLYNPGFSILLKPQGLFCHGGRKSHRWYRTGLLDAANSLVVAVNEMLVQSYSDHFRVFPAVPFKGSVSFSKLRVQGPFLLSAEMKGGETSYIIVESPRKTVCRLLNPWSGQTVSLIDLVGNKHRFLRGKYLKFETDVGGVYRLASHGSRIVDSMESSMQGTCVTQDVNKTLQSEIRNRGTRCCGSSASAREIPAKQFRDSPHVLPLVELYATYGWQVIYPDIGHFQTTGQEVIAQNSLCLGLPSRESIPGPGRNPLSPTLEELKRMLKSKDWKERQSAIAVVDLRQLHHLLKDVGKALKDSHRLVRWTAAHKLALFAREEIGVLPLSVSLLASPECQQRWTAFKGLQRVSSSSFGYDPELNPCDQRETRRKWQQWLKDRTRG